VRKVHLTGQFRRDVKLARRRGKDLGKLRMAMEIIVGGNPLPPQYRDHPLRGEFHGSRDCHLEPDWLLIYTLNPSDPVVCFERTGTHADLFGS
jgi:mRNA interferase YafQ